MNTPSCRNCRTDVYLRYLDFTPAKHYTQRHKMHQGTITRDRTDPPVSDFFCAKCGLRDGRSVPMDWVEPQASTSDEAILEKFGEVYVAPGVRKTRDGWTYYG